MGGGCISEAHQHTVNTPPPDWTITPPTRLLGVFVTREHVRHNKSGITHRGKSRISH
jgi:hypothetical protein